MKKAFKLLALLLIITATLLSFTGCIFEPVVNFFQDVFLFGVEHKLTLEINDPAMGEVRTDARSSLTKGSVANLTATPNYGYVFKGWYNGEELVSDNTKLSYTMPYSDVTLRAVFAKDKFSVRILSMNPEFTGGVDKEFEYLDRVTVSANEIENSGFFAWFVDGEVYSTDETFTLTVEEDITIYAEYYGYEAQEIYEWPTAEAATVGTPLSEVALVGGSANVLGHFEWATPDVEVYEGGEYVVVFIPLSTGKPEAEHMISVPLATTVLDAPVISVEGGSVKWEPVSDASGYTVYVNDDEHEMSVSDTSLTLPTEMNEYFVYAVAIGDGVKTANSKQSNIERYVPERPSYEDFDFGQAKPEYNQDDEMVKFGGAVDVTPENFDIVTDDEVVFEDDLIRFRIEVDISEYLTKATKRKILDLNKFGVTTEVSIVLKAEVVIEKPSVYAEIDLGFPTIIRDLAFGVSYKSMISTVLDVSVNGEFVEAEQRRGTLHLMFMDLIGLEEPLYKWAKATLVLKNSPLQVELALCFDAIGAIAADLSIGREETTNYSAVLHAVKDGVPIFAPYFNKDVETNVTKISLDGELDVNINCIRLSASLQLKNKDEVISVLRLNLDPLNIESDLSGNVDLEFDGTESLIPEIDADAEINGSYYVYGQVTFEYYLEIEFKFKYLPLDDFKIKLLDGSYILMEWEYVKGGIPKTPYRDEAIHNSTPIFATDGVYDYFINLDGELICAEDGENYFLAGEFADLDGDEIVDVDDFYIYVLSGNKLRRIGRAAGTERTVLTGVNRVVYSDRSYIYYTLTSAPNVIKSYYRSDMEAAATKFAKLPSDIEAVRMRYDHLLECYVIYGETAGGTAYYFSYNGSRLTRHSGFEHAWWDNVLFDDGSIAYYRENKNGDITECFIRGADKGVTHTDNALSIGISPIGIFAVSEKKGDLYNYELGLYPLGKSSGAYLKVAEVCDPNAAKRIAYYGNEAYFTDFDGKNVTVYKTDGEHVRVVAVSELTKAASLETVKSEIHGDWLFVYEDGNGAAKVIYAIDVYTLDTAPYLAGDPVSSFDKGDPADVRYSLGGDLALLGVFLNRFTDEEYAKMTEDVKNYVERWNKINEFMEKNFNFWKDNSLPGDDIISFLNEYGDFFFPINASVEDIETEGSYLGNLSLTISKDDLDSYSYGRHSGYIVTTLGIFEIKVNVVDSRIPTYSQEIVPSYDKGDPSKLHFEVTLYDSEYSFDDVPEDAYEAQRRGEVTVFTFYPHFLSTLEYGENSIILRSEGDRFELKLLVEDSRTPKDSTYIKHFDLTYPKNVTFEFELFDEKYVTKVEGNDIPEHGAYTVSEEGNAVTLLGRYLDTLTPGEYVFTLTTAEKTFDIVLVVIRSALPIAPEAVTHDMGTGEDLTIDFEKNDASSMDVYINGKLLSDDYWRYSFVTGSIIIDNDYLLSNMDYGSMSVVIRSIIYSADDIQSHVNNVKVTLTDSRTPVILNSDQIYVIPDKNPPALFIDLLLYNGEVESVIADGTVALDHTVYKDDMYRRSVVIQINSMNIVDVLAEGEHTVAVNVGGVSYVMNLTVRDERLPKISGSDRFDYDIDYPNSAAYIVRLYGERFISIAYGEELLPDDAYSFVKHSDNGLYHILVLNEDYLASLGLGYSQTASFKITTGVNTLEVYVITGMDPNNVEKPDEPDSEPEEKPDNKKPLTPPVYTPVDIATSVKLSPSTVNVDASNVKDIVLTPSYGSNNSFGALKLGSYTLVKGTDFNIGSDGAIILGTSYLKTLTSYGKYTLKLYGAKGKNTAITIVVYDSRSPYLEEEKSFEYDRFEKNSISFDAVMYDSSVKYIRVDGVSYTSGIKNSGSTITLNNALLDSFGVGSRTAYIGFNDTSSEIAITITTRDTGLYLSNTRADKAAFADDAAELTIPWTLYEGSIDGCTSSTLNVVSFDTAAVTLSGFYSAPYGEHSLEISANGHEFTLKVSIYDSRKPKTEKAEYSFDKGAQDYSLDPNVTKAYDVRIILELYDEQIKGLDMLSKQTIRGNGIEYEDYEREGNDYVINYLYLYRLPIGSYKYYISTTDGDVEVDLTVSDSRAPSLKNADPAVYDYYAGGDLDIEMNLYNDDISSLSYIDPISGNRILLTRGTDYDIEALEEYSVLTLGAAFLSEGFYDGYTYKFTLVSVTERVLDFNVLIENGPRRPFKVTYYSVPWREGEPEYSIESLTLYEGDMIPVPDTPSFNYYNFLGFYTERTGGALFDFTKPISSDCDIFLHWEPMTYVITLISDGEVIGTHNVRYLSDIPAIATPVKEGYTFIKWTVDEEHAIRFNPAGETMPHRDITLYAQWQINQYTVIFKDKDGVVLSEQTLYAYEDAVAPADEEMLVEHYEFIGWDKTYTSVLSDLVCNAVYKPINYDINYVLGDGSLPGGAPTTYTIEGGVKLPTPTLTGYDFLGWYLDEEYTVGPVTSIDFGTLPGFTVYARFVVATYDVYLNSTVGTVEYDIFGAPDGNKLRITYETEYVLPRVLAPEGYFFLGWFSGQNGTGTRYSDYLGNGVGPWSTASNVTLYAHVVSLLDFADIAIKDSRVSFNISTYQGATVTITEVALICDGEIIATIPQENLAATSFEFADLLVETAYEIKVSYNYTIPDVDGERQSYSSFKIKMTDDAYPETVIGNTVAKIYVGKDLFSSFVIDGITVLDANGEAVNTATKFTPDSSNVFYESNKGWVIVLDLVMNTEYDIVIDYHYTLKNYDGTYISTVTKRITTGTSISGVTIPVLSIDISQVSDGSDDNYYYYTYRSTLNYSTVALESNLRITRWELLYNNEVKASGTIDQLNTGYNNSYSVTFSRSSLTSGGTHQIKFYYTYDLQNGLGTQSDVIVKSFVTTTSASKPSSGGGGGPCVEKGTDVLMADGTIKNIEDVKVGDLVLVWDFYTGNYGASPVILIHASKTTEMFYLNFENGKRIGVGLAHGFFVDGQFEEVTYDNADEFIGRSFLCEENGEMYYTTLESVERSDAETEIYALVTAKHYNHFADGFVSVIPYVELVSIFEYDGLKYDEDLMVEDLEKYGIADYSDCEVPATEEQFYMFGGEYFLVAFGKGVFDVEFIADMIETYFYNDEIIM